MSDVNMNVNDSKAGEMEIDSQPTTDETDNKRFPWSAEDGRMNVVVFRYYANSPYRVYTGMNLYINSIIHVYPDTADLSDYEVAQHYQDIVNCHNQFDVSEGVRGKYYDFLEMKIGCSNLPKFTRREFSFDKLRGLECYAFSVKYDEDNNIMWNTAKESTLHPDGISNNDICRIEDNFKIAMSIIEDEKKQVFEDRRDSIKRMAKHSFVVKPTSDEYGAAARGSEFDGIVSDNQNGRSVDRSCDDIK